MGNYNIEQLLQSGVTPMMQQYLDVKKNNLDSIIFYRLGDFYEMFFDDAIIASKELELTLTGRDCGMEERAPMCGVPFHSAEGYIAKLIEKGYKVSICEQLEDAKEAKGLVKRDVVRVISPGTVTDINSLKESENNYICSLYGNNDGIAVVFADVSTGDLNISNTIIDDFENKILNELAKFAPSELIVNSFIAQNEKLMHKINKTFRPYINIKEDNIYQFDKALDTICERFGKDEIEKMGINNSSQTILSLYGLLSYLVDTQKNDMEHIKTFEYYEEEQFMDIDISTKRNLELTETLREKKKYGSLLGVLDKTNTSMGARLLKHYIDRPLKSYTLILKRLNGVNELYNSSMLRDELITALKTVNDIERLCSKISYRTANARDVVSLKNSLMAVPKLKEILISVNAPILKEIDKMLDPMEDVVEILSIALEDEPPISVKDGGLIRDGFNPKLDEYKLAMREGKDWIAQIELQEKEKTGIKNLKISYNKVFGYYLEVTKSYLNLVPEYFVRKQTLANCERYITPKLKEVENLILGAEEKSVNIEYELFCELRELIYNNILRAQNTARAIAKLDVLISFANVAYKNHYVMPNMSDDGKIIIKDGRHPVVEQMLTESVFVSNDTYLDLKNDSFSLITGPNMAGKSTYMRQVALISLMAQIGSFVPCGSASLSIVDKIFTRVGASDDLASGQSTFMVEMTEVSNILKNASKHSLVILDEIGRGTSTFDGLSIAWAVVEHIVRKIGAKTLFATHYHELTILEEKLKGVKNYSVAVKKRGDDITFLRKIIDGGTEKSYGIEVALLAGLPKTLISRAKEIAIILEGNELSLNEISDKTANININDDKEEQIKFTSVVSDEIIRELKAIDVSVLTPIEALNILNDLSKKAKE